MSDLKHYDNLGTVRFVTISCYRRYRLLIDDYNKMIFLQELAEARQLYGLKIFGYVIMPNHIHLVILPHEYTQLGSLIGRIKAVTARKIISKWKSEHASILSRLCVTRGGRLKFAVWTPRCFDHNCRSMETTLEKIKYCHNNPVKAGLVKNAREWIWSSYGWYHGDKQAILEIDSLDI